ncbi:MAG: HupE/UreJ family protein [Pseudolabrys sp.]
MALVPHAAFAHIGVGSTAPFAAGFAHPFSGLDHIAVMVSVGLWAALKGGRALWAWPLAFVSVMLAGGALGMAQIHVPFVEPGILASVMAIGLLVALAIDLPVWLGAGVMGLFAVFHGHAHGTEVAENVSGLEYMAGFALATASLHAVGLGMAFGLAGLKMRAAIRLAGVGCVALGIALAIGIV